MWLNPSLSGLANSAMALVLTALIAAILYFGSGILIPLTLAGFLSLILQPLVRLLHEWFIPRSLSVFSVVVLTTLILLISVSFLAREASFLATDLPKYEANLREKAKAAADAMQNVGIWYNASQVFERIEVALKAPTEVAPIKVEVQQQEFRSLAALIAYVKLTLSSLTTLGLTFVFTIVFLLQYYDLRDRLVYLFGPSEIGRTTQALNQAALDLSLFFRLQAGLNICFGIVVGLALWVLGLPNAALWGALAGISRFVPYVGSIIAAAGPLLVAAAIDPGWSTLAAAALIIVVSEFIVGYAIEPLLFGTKTRMSPLAVLIAAAFWALIWGPLGLILALPITLAIVVFAEHFPSLAFFRVIFGNSPALSEAQALYHMLLAGHAARATGQAERFIEERDAYEYVDRVFIPAMATATKDLNAGIFRPEQLDHIRKTIKEFVVSFKELLAISSRPQQEPVDLKENRPTIMMIAGRGFFDQAMTEVAAFTLGQSNTLRVSCTPLGGLTGIAAAKESIEGEFSQVVIVSAGGVTDHQLALLCERAKRDLSTKGISVLKHRDSLNNASKKDSNMYSSISRLSHDLLSLSNSVSSTLVKLPSDQSGLENEKLVTT